MCAVIRIAPLTLALCLALPVAARAQDSSSPAADIVVTGRGLPEAPGAPAYDRIDALTVNLF